MSPSATSISLCSAARSPPPNTSPRPSPTCACTDATTSEWFDSDNRNDRYNYLYNERELAGWKDRIENVAESAQTTYVITNNHFESKAGVNALELKAMVTGKRVPAPPTLVQKYPELRRFADPMQDGENPAAGGQALATRLGYKEVLKADRFGKEPEMGEFIEIKDSKKHYGKLWVTDKPDAPLLIVFGGKPVGGRKSGDYMWDFMDGLKETLHIFVADTNFADGNDAYNALMKLLPKENDSAPSRSSICSREEDALAWSC